MESTDFQDLNDLIMVRMRAGDPLLNYCQWEYKPLSDPLGKLRASSLLFLACSRLPHASSLAETLIRIQQAIGEYRGVYGVKWDGGKLTFEIYIYDYARECRLFSIENFFRYTCGRLTTSVTVPRATPYFMFSFELTPEFEVEGRDVDLIDIYLGNPGSKVSSGISYRCSPYRVVMENVYFFFEPRGDYREIKDKIACSVLNKHSEEIFRSVLYPYGSPCHTICVANKRERDAVYVSGVPIATLSLMLDQFNWPVYFQSFVLSHWSLLDHLKFDIGFDYGLRHDALAINRSAFYSSF